jgi:hypothetical protein
LPTKQLCRLGDRAIRVLKYLEKLFIRAGR